MNIVHEIRISTATLRMVQRGNGYSMTVLDERQPGLIGVAFLARDPVHAERKYCRIIDRESEKLRAES